jgi:hypothetical protein
MFACLVFFIPSSLAVDASLAESMIKMDIMERAAAQRIGLTVSSSKSGSS